MLWVLNFSDGKHTGLDIAEWSGLTIDLLADVAEVLRDANLLKE